MTEGLIAVLIVASLAGLVTTCGIYVMRKYVDVGSRYSVYFISFAAGVLIGVSFLHLIPKSFELTDKASAFLLVGFIGLYLVNRYINVMVCDDPEKEGYIIGIIPVLGIGLHSFLDGFVYSVTFNVSIFTGVLAAIGMILHEFPEGIVTFVLLKRSGFSIKQASWYAFLAAGLSTPLGTLVSYPFVSSVEPSTLGILLALSAGTLLYVGASHLLPVVEKESQRFTTLVLLIGVLIAILIVLSGG